MSPVFQSTPYLLRNLALALLLCCAMGCSHHTQRISRARQYFYDGDLSTAAVSLDEHRQKYPNDADATALDLAMVQLVAGEPAEAEATLRQVRDNLDHLEQGDAAELGLSMLTDDQQLAYSGANYEKVLTRVFLTLSNLLTEGDDATAYSLQINAKQQDLLQRATEEKIEDAAQAYAPLAIGPYLHGMLRESTFANYDDAARAYHQVVSWQPDFQSGRVDLARAQTGVHSPPGCGVVYVFALVNRGPVKVQVSEMPTTVALLIADRILSAVGEYDVPPTLAPIQVPRVMVPPRSIACVSLANGSRELARTETICDVADLALREEKVQMPHIMGRAVARRLIKKAAIYGVKDVVEADHPLADIGLSAVGVIWEATESADTRCWGLLPREIQVARLELPAGQHTLELNPVLPGGSAVRGTTATVHVEDGRNTYLLACFPGNSAVGELVQR